MRGKLAWALCLPLVAVASGCLGAWVSPTASPRPQQPSTPAVGRDSVAVFVGYQKGTRWVSRATLWVVRGGGKPTRLARLRFPEAESPVISPSGRKVAFVAPRVFGDGSDTLGVVNVASGRVRVLARGLAVTGTGPAWSPDGRYLAFTAWTSAPVRDCLFMVDVRTGRLVQLTSHRHHINDSGAVWSANGQQIMFSEHMGHRWRTLLIDVRTRAIRVVPAPAGFVPESWQPHGRVVGRTGQEISVPAALARSRGGWVEALPGAPVGESMGWSADGRFLLIATRPSSSGGTTSESNARPTVSCTVYVAYDLVMQRATRIACATAASWEPGVDRVLYMRLTRAQPATSILFTAPAALHSVAATGRDRRLLARGCSPWGLAALGHQSE